jgi:hypothetical protein
MFKVLYQVLDVIFIQGRSAQKEVALRYQKKDQRDGKEESLMASHPLIFLPPLTNRKAC